MKLHNLRVIFWLLTIIFGTFFSAHAQGVIIPIICERPPRCPQPLPRPRPIILPQSLPVKSIQLDTKISGQVATTHVTQVFRNDTDATLEGTYFFPIPETASIVEFALWEGEKRLVGEVRTREEARRIYEDIVRRQRDPGLLEYAGKDLFQATIFPIPPRSDKKLEIKYSQILKAESGTVSFRYPLGTGRQKVPIGTVSGRVEISANQALRNIYSPSHSIDVKNNGETKATLSFESSNKTEQQDFQLFYGLSNNDFGLSLVTQREAAKDGYFLLILSPKDSVTDQEYVSKDVIFVLDTSGSMAEEGKMEKARAALLFGVRSLRSGDRFNVINFAGEEHLMEAGLTQADARGKQRGEEFVKRLQPTGGTNINDALRAALRQFDTSDRPKLLVFMTDGLPTVGETNVEKIINNAKQIKVDGLRLFTFGVGYDVNTTLLDKLAAENSGSADYVEPKENLEVKVSNFFTKVSSPVLTDIEIDFGGVMTDLVYPRKMPDLFKGTQITLIGRYRNGGNMDNVRIRVTGKTGRDTRTFTYDNLDFPLRSEGNEFLPRLWATRRVGWLLEQIRINGVQKELRDEIVELGTRYGIVTPYTSYLATENNFRVDTTRTTVGGGIVRDGFNKPMAKRPQPTSNQSVVTVEDEESLRSDSGQGAVKTSKETKRKKDADKIEKQTSSAVRNVGSKTFYLDENEVWVDSELKPEAKLPEVKLTFASAEYFDLLKREKDLGQYFALGEQVIVVFKGKVYRVVK
jgi:Ca-activated chloride channel family protein